MDNIEIWKNIVDFNDYQVSNLGRVKSLKFNKENLLVQCKASHGYLVVRLCSKGVAVTFGVHKLVADSFLNHISKKHILAIDHIDNDKTNNKLNNLQIISVRENLSKDQKNKTSKYTGVVYRGEKRNKWESSIYINKKLNYLGSFNTEIEAHNAYQKALSNLL